MTASPVIEAVGLRKRYGDQEAVAGVDLAVPAGRILGVLGPNGAGKSTTVRMLTTMTTPDGGTGRVAGYDIVRDARAVRRIIGVTGQDASLDEQLSGTQNLVMVGELSKLPRKVARTRSAELLERFELSDAADRPVKTYSGGMRRRLDLAASLVTRPAGAVPRRAHHRARPHQPPAHVGCHPRAGRRRHHAAAHHPVPRRGRRPGRPHLGHRPRRRHRRGHGPRAQGPHRRRAARGHAQLAPPGGDRRAGAAGGRRGAGVRRRAPAHGPHPGPGRHRHRRHPGARRRRRHGRRRRGPPAVARRRVLRPHRAPRRARAPPGPADSPSTPELVEA